MTSKEALEQLKESLEDEVGSFGWIDELYGIVLKDLERLEEINKVWHKNEPMESVDFKAYYLQILYDYINVKEKEIKIFKEENEKLKKAVEKEIELLTERRFNAYACDDYETHNVLNTIIEELKEVLDNELLKM